MRKEDYDKWVEEACQYIKKVSSEVRQKEGVNVGSTQYIPKLEGDIEFVFLGHDAHEGRGEGELVINYSDVKKRFYEGNGDPRQWRNDSKWKIWRNIEKAFRIIGFNEILENGVISDEILEKTIVTNALLFNYIDKAIKLNAVLGPDIVNECMNLAGELIFDVIKPKMVICSSCPLVFEPLINNYKKNHKADIPYEVFHLNGTRKRVMRCNYNGITILGIPHTSYPVPKAVAAFVRDSYMGKDIGSTMSDIASIPSGFVSYKNSINLKHIIELVTSSQDFALTKIENTSEDYSLSDNLMIRITKTGNGYLAIRHKNYKIPYPNSKYESTERYGKVLKNKGWNSGEKAWIAKKNIKDFGCTEDEIVSNIVSEINDIVNLVR